MSPHWAWVWGSPAHIWVPVKCSGTSDSTGLGLKAELGRSFRGAFIPFAAPSLLPYPLTVKLKAVFPVFSAGQSAEIWS